MNKIVNIVLYFIVGGSILSSVHYFANCMVNTALAALCALLPIGLLCAFIIEKEEPLESYAYHLGIVYILSIVSVVVLWVGVKYVKVFPYIFFFGFVLHLFYEFFYNTVNYSGLCKI